MGKQKTIDTGKTVSVKKIDKHNIKYVEDCYSIMLPQYPSLKKMQLKEQADNANEKLKSDVKARPWPCHEAMLSIKQYSTQEEMLKKCNDIHDYWCVCDGVQNIDLNLVHVNFCFGTKRYCLQP